MTNRRDRLAAFGEEVSRRFAESNPGLTLKVVFEYDHPAYVRLTGFVYEGETRRTGQHNYAFIHHTSGHIYGLKNLARQRCPVAVGNIFAEDGGVSAINEDGSIRGRVSVALGPL